MAGMAAADIVYLTLRDDIVRRRYRPGDVLSRTGLAAELGVSQTPLREALGRLAQDGFVEILPRSMTRVRPIQILELHEGHFLAVGLAVETVRRLAGRPGSAERLVGLSGSDFLLAMFEAIGMSRLWDRLGPYFSALDRCRALETAAEGTRSGGFEADIVTRIAKGDVTGATAAVRALLAEDLAPLGHWRARHPAMFA